MLCLEALIRQNFCWCGSLVSPPRMRDRRCEFMLQPSLYRCNLNCQPVSSFWHSVASVHHVVVSTSVAVQVTSEPESLFERHEGPGQQPLPMPV